MTLRKWFHLFWTTLLLGIFLGVALGLILQFSDQNYNAIGIPGVGFNAVNMAIAGATISALSQMGYFAYLIVRYIGIGIIRNKTIWDLLQWAIIIVVMFDTFYLRFTSYKGSFISYFWLPALIFILAWGTAVWKVRLTNPSGFLPTLFFMSAVTILEAVPALKLNNWSSSLFMLVPLMACNAWQILILPRILQKEKS